MIGIAQARPPFVQYEVQAVFDPQRSEEMGYRVTKDVNYVKVMQAGSKECYIAKADDWLEQIKRKAIHQDHDAFPQEWVNAYIEKYEAWKKGLEAPLNGTSVKQWPLLTPAQANNFVALNILTIEDVAAMNEEAMQRFGMGARDLREKAKEWISERSIKASLAAENEELKRQLAELAERMAQLEEDKPKRGRPAKLKEAA